MAAKYRRIDPRTWKDEKFQSLPRLQKLIVLYLLTGQGNRIGIFSFSAGMAIEDLGTDSDGEFLSGEEFRRELTAALKVMAWEMDTPRGVVYMPTWWRYNSPANDNSMIGALTDLDDLPKTELFRAFAENTKYIRSDRLSVFREHITRYFNRFGIDGETKSKLPTPGTGAGTVSETGTEAETGMAASPTVSQTTPRFDPLKITIPPVLDTPAFLAAWSKWIISRRERRLSNRESVLLGQLEFLAQFGETGAIQSITESIRCDWKGVFPPKEKPQGKNPSHITDDFIRRAGGEV